MPCFCHDATLAAMIAMIIFRLCHAAFAAADAAIVSPLFFSLLFAAFMPRHCFFTLSIWMMPPFFMLTDAADADICAATPLSPLSAFFSFSRLFFFFSKGATALLRYAIDATGAILLSPASSPSLMRCFRAMLSFDAAIAALLF